jgi:dTDP-4-amino-4,6-dideoxygalactose transaminase
MAYTRRSFFMSASGAAVAARTASAAEGKPAILGGTPLRSNRFPSWPVISADEEDLLIKVLRSGKWNRNDGGQVREFERQFASKLGAKHCLATTNGTSSLIISLACLGVGPGDEVIVPPYTFVATVNAVLMMHAVPVFADTDINTFQVDPKSVERMITQKTACVIPVHLGGNVADMDALLAIGKKRNIPILEDACQAHLAEWRGKKVSTLGQMGCFSFQASKNLNCGEGGGVLTNEDELIAKARSFHNNGRGTGEASFEYIGTGCNLRMTEFQAAILTAQMRRLEQQSKTREANAAYLDGQLREIGGLSPARQYEGCTRNAYHLYMFRYDKDAFGGLSRAKFLKAMAAEGIPCSSGYKPLNKEPFLTKTFESKGWRRIYGNGELRGWQERNQCPVNDRLCEEAVWFTQTMLLGPRSDMDDIVAAIRRIKANAGAIG